jgi:lactaldehyde dehydrogenase / glycolaldehyde dehydrogenase
MEPTNADGTRRAAPKTANLIDENSETLAALLTAEGGKVLPESRIDANFAALLLRYAAESARRLQGEILLGEGRDEQIWIQRVPYGVVAGITAWNFPAALFARKVGPALVTGNTIVVKPHELTSLTTLVLGKLSRRAGIPEGVINVLVGDGRTVGAHLVSHKDTDLVSMTGSVRAGGEIYALGAERIKPIRLELGYYLLHQVPFGGRIFATGGTPIAARFSGSGRTGRRSQPLSSRASPHRLRA